MNDSAGQTQIWDLQRKATEIAMRLFVVGGLALWCFLILEPFFLLLVWAIVPAIALSPAFNWLEPRPDPLCDLSQACARVRADGMAMIDCGQMGSNSERATRTKGLIFTVI